MVINGKGIAVSYSKSTRKNKNSKSYALKPVDIKIIPGEVSFILGRSGSGKTTLLSVLAGLLKPSEGTVLYDAFDIYKEKDDDFSLFRNKNIGFIPQGQSQHLAHSRHPRNARWICESSCKISSSFKCSPEATCL